MACIYCYTTQDQNILFCPRCGEPLPRKTQSQDSNQGLTNPTLSAAKKDPAIEKQGISDTFQLKRITKSQPALQAVQPSENSSASQQPPPNAQSLPMPQLPGLPAGTQGPSSGTQAFTRLQMPQITAPGQKLSNFQSRAMPQIAQNSPIRQENAQPPQGSYPTDVQPLPRLQAQPAPVPNQIMTNTPPLPVQTSNLPVPVQLGGLSVQQTQKVSPAPEATHIQTISGEQAATIAKEQGLFYIPPDYTRPRPTIPAYRAISGLISLVLVCILLGVGAFYYNKAHGQFDLLNPDAALLETPTQIPMDQPEKGPAFSIIPSASLTNYAGQQDVKFPPNQQFTLLYHVEYPQSPGVVKAIWYKDGVYYKTLLSAQIAAQDTFDGSFPMSYDRATKGKVELYWNDQLAQSITFSIGQ